MREHGDGEPVCLALDDEEFYWTISNPSRWNVFAPSGGIALLYAISGLFFQLIPTRRIKSISKLFCIADLIRGGFIWYRLSLSYGLFEILLSKIYQRQIITGYAWFDDMGGLYVL